MLGIFTYYTRQQPLFCLIFEEDDQLDSNYALNDSNEAGSAVDGATYPR